MEREELEETLGDYYSKLLISLKFVARAVLNESLTEFPFRVDCWMRTVLIEFGFSGGMDCCTDCLIPFIFVVCLFVLADFPWRHRTIETVPYSRLQYSISSEWRVDPYVAFVFCSRSSCSGWAVDHLSVWMRGTSWGPETSVLPCHKFHNHMSFRSVTKIRVYSTSRHYSTVPVQYTCMFDQYW